MLDNGGYTSIEWVSIAYFAVDRKRAYTKSENKKDEFNTTLWTNPEKRDYRHYENLYAYINYDFSNYG